MALFFRNFCILLALCSFTWAQDSGLMDPFGETKGGAAVPAAKAVEKKPAKKPRRAAPPRAAAAPVLQFENTLVQYAPFCAFCNKFYRGDMDLRTLSTYGDFGFGAFNSLEALMVANDGKFYKISPDGGLELIDDDQRAHLYLPFALVSKFRGDISMTIPIGEGRKYVEEKLIKNLPSANYPVAVRITGKFAKVSTRALSVESADETFYKLLEKNRTEREFIDIFGTIVGFFIPKHMGPTAPEGWRFFFINEYADGGGELVDFESGKLAVRAEMLNLYYLIMPNDAAFRDLKMGQAKAPKAPRSPAAKRD